MIRWFAKQRYIVDFTLSSLLRRKVKTIGLVVLYTAMVFLLASVMFFTDALKREAKWVLEGSPELLVQRTLAGRHELLPAAYLDRLLAIRGVTGVAGRLWGYYYEPNSDANYTVMAPPFPLQDQTLASFDPAALQAGKVVIGPAVARQQALAIGDTMVFRSHDGSFRDLQVGGVFATDSELVSADLVLMTAEDFRSLFGLPAGIYTDAVVAVANPSEVGTIASKIARDLPDTRPIVRDEILRTYDAVFNWRSGMIIVLAASTLIAFVIFAWDRASGLSASEKREIGILKAIGWETSDILAMKFWEGAVVSLTAFLAGIILAYVHVFLSGAPLFEHALKGWATLYPRFRLTPLVSVERVATLFFLTVVPYTLSTLVPAWRAAIADPDTAMRHTGE